MGEPVIGIDLGTTNSCVAVMRDDGPVVIPNLQGDKTLPSVVAMTPAGKRLVGAPARRQAITNADGTAFAVKRLIGRPYASPVVQALAYSLPYRLAPGPHGETQVVLGGRPTPVPELSAFVLQELRFVAEEFLGEEVRKAVITVPAHFGDGQRQATRDAGRIAGLDVLRMINEPTAAAIAFGLGRKGDRRIAVYDLGGGTFDISILRVSSGVFEVLATAGDGALGGEDLDDRLVGWLAQEIADEHGVDVRDDRMALQRLKEAAEKAKCELSAVASIELNLPFLFQPPGGEAINLRRTLTRRELEDKSADLLQRTVRTCAEALAEAHLRPADVDEVVLVGGMTRMPRVQELVAGFFGREPSKGVHPDEVVALGAAIHGASLLEGRPRVKLTDVAPHSLGLATAGGGVHRLIPRNTALPTFKSYVFTTSRDDQTTLKFQVVQGEGERAEENTVLDELTLVDLRPAPKGTVDIKVTFQISSDGLVSVAARDLETGRQQTVRVTPSSGMSEDEVQRLAAENREVYVGLRAAAAGPQGGAARPRIHVTDELLGLALAGKTAPPMAARMHSVLAPGDAFDVDLLVAGRVRAIGHVEVASVRRGGDGEPSTVTMRLRSARATARDPLSTDGPASRLGLAGARPELEVAVSLDSAHNFFTGLDRDVSTGGLFIAAPAGRRPGEQVRLRLALLGEARPIGADAEVVWIREESQLVGGGPPGFGVRFVGLAPDDAEAIARFVGRRDPMFYDS